MANLEINVDRCKGCGLCEKFCPKKILTMSKSTNSKGYNYIVESEGCIKCGACRTVCPDLVIEIK